MKTKNGFVGFIIVLVLLLCCCCVLSMCGLVNIGRGATVYRLNDPNRDLHLYVNNHL